LTAGSVGLELSSPLSVSADKLDFGLSHVVYSPGDDPGFEPCTTQQIEAGCETKQRTSNDIITIWPVIENGEVFCGIEALGTSYPFLDVPRVYRCLEGEPFGETTLGLDEVILRPDLDRTDNNIQVEQNQEAVNPPVSVTYVPPLAPTPDLSDKTYEDSHKPIVGPTPANPAPIITPLPETPLQPADAPTPVSRDEEQGWKDTPNPVEANPDLWLYLAGLVTVGAGSAAAAGYILSRRGRRPPIMTNSLPVRPPNHSPDRFFRTSPTSPDLLLQLRFNKEGLPTLNPLFVQREQNGNPVFTVLQLLPGGGSEYKETQFGYYVLKNSKRVPGIRQAFSFTGSPTEQQERHNQAYTEAVVAKALSDAHAPGVPRILHVAEDRNNIILYTQCLTQWDNGTIPNTVRSWRLSEWQPPSAVKALKVIIWASQRIIDQGNLHLPNFPGIDLIDPDWCTNNLVFVPTKDSQGFLILRFDFGGVRLRPPGSKKVFVLNHQDPLQMVPDGIHYTEPYFNPEYDEQRMDTYDPQRSPSYGIAIMTAELLGLLPPDPIKCVLLKDINLTPQGLGDSLNTTNPNIHDAMRRFFQTNLALEPAKRQTTRQAQNSLTEILYRLTKEHTGQGIRLYVQ
jgi:hypothetical protein